MGRVDMEIKIFQSRRKKIIIIIINQSNQFTIQKIKKNILEYEKLERRKISL